MKYTDVNSQLASNFIFSNHFVCPAQLWDSPWGYAGSAIGCINDGISFRLGKTNIIFAALGIFLGIYIFFIKKKKDHTFLFLFNIFLLFFSLFMLTNISQPVWSLIPGIKFLQFPWRFLNIAGLSLAVLVGFLVYLSKSLVKNKYLPSLLTSLIVVSTLYLNLKLFAPQYHNNRTSSYYTNKNQINFIISKITNEYMPEGFKRPESPDQVPTAPFIIKKGKGEITVLEDQTGILQAGINMQTPGEIHINKAYFPAWNLFLNDRQTRLSPSSQGMSFQIPAGNHKIALRFVQTPIEKFAGILTVTGGLALFIGIISVFIKNSYGKKAT